MVIVLSILKIAGMILLFLGIAVACVLLVPLQYEGAGDIDKKTYRFRVSWLFRAIQFRIQTEGEASSYALYLFGIRTGILDPERVERRKQKKAERKHRQRLKKYMRARKRYLKERAKRQAQISLDPEGKKMSDPEHGSGQEGQRTEDGEETKGADAVDSKEEKKNRETVSEKESVRSKGADASGGKTADAGSGQFSDLWQKVKKICDVLKAARQAELLHLLLPLKTLFYHMRPRKITGDIQFGFEDPSLTGRTVGALSCVFVLYQYEELYITPDFEAEESYISGSVWGKGHIRMIHLLLCGIRILKQKEFRGFLKSLKQN